MVKRVSLWSLSKCDAKKLYHHVMASGLEFWIFKFGGLLPVWREPFFVLVCLTLYQGLKPDTFMIVSLSKVLLAGVFPAVDYHTLTRALKD